ncbi:hypothetical protein ABI59_15075 [Acidobacteria bacterium Mor1]|nr:hypothetical protein ABI59_15075 [Acidobacteria bacterium Mor1]
MKQETTIDRFGRVLIPKSVRDALALEPGSVLTLEELRDGLVLRLRDESPTFEVREGVLVYGGELIESPGDPVQRDRDDRIESFLPKKGAERRSGRKRSR